MALIWLCVALLLAAVLVFLWAICAAAGAAEEREGGFFFTEPAETSPPATPPVHVIYPGIPLEDGFQAYIANLCREKEVSVPLVLAVIAKESDFDAKLVADGGHSFGLMQIQPQWHRERMRDLGVTDLLDPAQNIRVGIDYLSELLSLGKGEEYAVMFYNGGEIHANYYAKRGEMSAYCTEVMRMRDCIGEAAMAVNG